MFEHLTFMNTTILYVHECNMVVPTFESSPSSYAHGLRGTFDRVPSNPTSQKLQLPPAASGPKRVESGETPTFV